MPRLVIRKIGTELLDQVLDPDKQYVVGRDPNCDLVLEAIKEISRQHFKIYFNDGRWWAEVISKYGHLLYNGSEHSRIDLQDGAVFFVLPFECLFKADTKDNIATAPAAIEPIKDEPSGSGSESFEVAALNATDSEDDTTHLGISMGVPFLTVHQTQGEQSTYRLEGFTWIVGSSENCDIILPGPQVAPECIEISKSVSGFSVCLIDKRMTLLVDGIEILPQNSVSIGSGSVFSIGGNHITFEIRDPNFDKKLVSIQSQVSVSRENNRPKFETQLSFPSANSVLLNSAKNPSQYFPWILSVILILGSLILIYFPGSKEDSSVSEKKPAQLSQEQLKYIKDTYELAKSLMLQQKFTVALTEWERLHKIVPFFKDSREFEERCRRAEETRLQLEAISQQKLKAKELEEKVAAIVLSCERRYKKSLKPSEVQQCLSEALELSPSNERARLLIAQAEEKQGEVERRLVEQANYRRRLAQGQSIYTRAQKLKSSGELYQALNRFKEYLNGKYPDTDDFREVAQREIASIETSLDSKYESVLGAAQEHAQNERFKQALASLDEAGKIDPRKPDVALLRSELLRKLSLRMKELYSESVLEESLGNIEKAKDRWRKITDLSISEESYYQKAQRKLRKYGE